MNSEDIADAFSALTHGMEPNGIVLVANDKTVLFKQMFGIADRHPEIVANRKRFQLGPLEETILFG